MDLKRAWRDWMEVNVACKAWRMKSVFVRASVAFWWDTLLIALGRYRGPRAC